MSASGLLYGTLSAKQTALQQNAEISGYFKLQLVNAPNKLVLRNMQLKSLQGESAENAQQTLFQISLLNWMISTMSNAPQHNKERPHEPTQVYLELYIEPAVLCDVFCRFSNSQS